MRELGQLHAHFYVLLHQNRRVHMAGKSEAIELIHTFLYYQKNRIIENKTNILNVRKSIKFKSKFYQTYLL